MTVHNWDDYIDPGAFRDEAETVVRGARSLEELLAVRAGAVRVGGHTVSTARRQLRAGALDLADEAIRTRLIDCLAGSMASAAAVERLHPGASTLSGIDRGYRIHAQGRDPGYVRAGRYSGDQMVYRPQSQRVDAEALHGSESRSRYQFAVRCLVAARPQYGLERRSERKAEAGVELRLRSQGLVQRRWLAN